MTVTTPTHPDRNQSPAAPSAQNAVECTLEIGGMTCASCVGRVQKALTRAEGVVTAAVNLATETAAVTYDPSSTDLDTLAAAVEKAGYTATPRQPDPVPGVG